MRGEHCWTRVSITKAQSTLCKPRADLFWPKVNKTDTCWLWTASTIGQFGYGGFGVARKTMYAHRVAWLLTYGAISDDMCVLHHCDVPLCVRPDHLFLGTHTDNIQDKMAKGRVPAGAKHHNVKLTVEDVKEIRRRAATGENRRHIAADFGVASQHVCHIHTRRYWKHVA